MTVRRAPLVLSRTRRHDGAQRLPRRSRHGGVGRDPRRRPPSQCRRSRAAPIDRYLRVTGSLAADEQAEVSAETAGRVVEIPVERGTRVQQGTLLARISATETSAQLQEAEANAAQIESRLGLTPGQPFEAKQVPDVMNAKASLDLAEAEFNRISSLLDQKVVSQSEFDQRRTQVEAARQQYQVALNSAQQSYRSLEAARARITLARKAVADTDCPRAIRGPRRGARGQHRRLRHARRQGRNGRPRRSAPDQLTVPEQSVSLVKVGLAVKLAVDAYPDEAFDAKHALRLSEPARRPACADGRGDRSERRRPTEAGHVRDGPNPLSRGRSRRSSFPRPPSRSSPAPAASTSSRTTGSRSGSSRSAKRSATVSRSPRASPRANAVATDPKGRVADGQTVASR